MPSISIRKKLTLSHRIFCTSPKTIRELLLTYLSKELGKMRDEGLITFHKNPFTVLHPVWNESH